MGFHQMACQIKAETRACRLRPGAGPNSLKSLEDLFTVGRVDSKTLVFHISHELSILRMASDFDRPAIG
jgi:hypothetical protein